MSLNPIIKTDYPDPVVIRVEDTYYMVSTTMYFFPGGAILRSYDLIHWEIVNYIFDVLDDTNAEHLRRESSIYGRGMWAPSLRYHEGTFYVAFFSASSSKTYLFTTKDILGKWDKNVIEGSYHDCSLLFDDDGRIYLVYGNTDIRIIELDSNLTGPKKGGLNRLIVHDDNDVILGYEGSHIQKINGKYYLFFIHWPRGGMRTEACFIADDLEGEFVGRDVLCDDRGYCGQGVAQGGLIDTPSGRWYAVLFQDSGAVGRIPILIPVYFGEDGFPVFGNSGKIPSKFEVSNARPYYKYEPIYTSDFYDLDVATNDKEHPALKKQWQWNHIPDKDLWRCNGNKGLRLITGKLCTNITYAVNTLTQRMMYPRCEAEVHIDASDMRDGDVAGLCALQGNYGYLAITRESGVYYLVKVTRNATEDYRIGAGDFLPGEEEARIRLNGSEISICLKANFEKMTDRLEFFYLDNNRYVKLGDSHRLVFKLDHFTGARFGLFMFSTKKLGGSAVFDQFSYRYFE